MDRPGAGRRPARRRPSGRRLPGPGRRRRPADRDDLRPGRLPRLTPRRWAGSAQAEATAPRGPLTVGPQGAGEASPTGPPTCSLVGRRLARQRPAGAPHPGPRGSRSAAGLSRRLPPDGPIGRAPPGGIGLQAPAHDLVREVLRLFPGPPVLGLRGAAACPAAAYRSLRGRSPGWTWSSTTGPTPTAGPSTVRPRLGRRLAGLRSGRDHRGGGDMTRMAGTIILFLCTGNTCRSPMAEALCKVRLAERLGCRATSWRARGTS